MITAGQLRNRALIKANTKKNKSLLLNVLYNVNKKTLFMVFSNNLDTWQNWLKYEIKIKFAGNHRINRRFPDSVGFFGKNKGINQLMKNKNLWFSERMTSTPFSYFFSFATLADLFCMLADVFLLTRDGVVWMHSRFMPYWWPVQIRFPLRTEYRVEQSGQLIRDAI